jgi:hypothetical protein
MLLPGEVQAVQLVPEVGGRAEESGGLLEGFRRIP